MTVDEHMQTILEEVEKLSADPEAMLVAANDAMTAVYAGWKRLSELRTIAAVDLRYTNGMAHEDIAGIIGVSRQRINQILDKTIGRQL